MKKLSLLFLFIPVFFLVLITGCNQQENILNPEETSAPTAQLNIVDPPNVECCTECGTTCILGFGFNSSANGYVVQQVSADECECESTSNGWVASTTGNRTSQAALWGGGGSGSPCNNSIEWMVLNLFGDNCAAQWHSPDPGNDPSPFGPFGAWSASVLDSLQRLGIPTGSSPFGLNNWPASWGIAVEALNSGDLIRIELATQFQADNFRRVGIFPNGSTTPVGTLQSNRSKIYVLDLSGQPDGFYNIKLDFAPGFNLNKVFQKTTPRR